MPDHQDVVPFLPGMNFFHKGLTTGVKCSVCGGFPEYRETNEHIRIRQKKEGPDWAVWLCSDCHRKYKLGEPDPERPQEVTPYQGDEPAGTIPERSQSEIKRDQNLEDRDQKSPKTIPESPVSENTGTEPADNGPEPENNGTEIEQTPPRPTPQVYTPKGEYTIPDVLGDVSLGIERDTVGFTLTFYRNGGKVGSHTTKTPPWLSPKVVTDTGAALLKVCPDLGKVYAKEHVRDTLTEVFKEVERAITDNPQAAALLLPPVVSHVLGRVERVAITLFKDGLGGGEPVYELFTGKDEDEDPRTVTMSLGDITADTPGLFKRRWTSVFVTDFLELTRSDWVTLRAALIDRAEVREAQYTGEGDAIVSELLEELGFMSFTELKDVWKAKTDAFLLCEHTPDGWLVFVNSKIIYTFLKRRDYDPNSWTPKLSKEFKNRGIITQAGKKVRVEKGPTGTIRVWTFTGTALGFHEDHLWERATPPKKENVPGGGNVPGTNAPNVEQTENKELHGPEHGGV